MKYRKSFKKRGKSAKGRRIRRYGTSRGGIRL